MKQILTIGIPTYNRAHSLKLMLPQLVSDLGNLVAKVEIIISDNCSQDNTQEIINGWIKSAPADLAIRSFRNDENIGVSKNLVSLFYLAETRFFMFLGDDDKIHGSFFPHLIDILTGINPPSAVIQGQWGGRSNARKYGYVSWNDAVCLFYEYGNAWAGVVDTKAAVNAIEFRGLRAEIEKIVWPQTVMAFLAMFDSSPRQVFITNEEIGSRFTGSFNVYNTQYVIKSLFGLLMAAKLVDKYLSQPVVKKVFLSARYFGLKSHAKELAIYTLIEGKAGNTYDIQNLLKESYGVFGYMWACVFFAMDNFKFLYWVAKVVHPIITFGRREGFENKLACLRYSYYQTLEVKNSKKRIGDWF